MLYVQHEQEVYRRIYIEILSESYVILTCCLCFIPEPDYEDPDIKEKKKEIEKCLENPDCVNLEQWQSFAKGKAGLISGESEHRHCLHVKTKDISPLVIMKWYNYNSR